VLRSVPFHYNRPSRGYNISNLAKTIPSGAARLQPLCWLGGHRA
jgi:hypothetical protein